MTTALSICVDRELEECACDIELAQTSAVWQIITIGKALSRAREIIREEGTRDFAEWCKSRVCISKSGAYRAIQVYEKFGERPTLGRLEVSAAYMLAMDDVPPEVREQAVEESKHQPVTAKRAKELIDDSHSKEKPTASSDSSVRRNGVSADDGNGVVPELAGERSDGLSAGDDDAGIRDRPRGPRVDTQARGPVPNEIGERRFAVRSVVEQQTDGQPAYVKGNIADLLEDLAKELRQ